MASERGDEMNKQELARHIDAATAVVRQMIQDFDEETEQLRRPS